MRPRHGAPAPTQALAQHFCCTVPHARSPSYGTAYGSAADPAHRAWVESLYERFKRELSERHGPLPGL